MWLMRGLGVVVAALALWALSTREQSRLACTREPAVCVLERSTPFSTTSRSIATRDIREVAVDTWGTRRPRRSLVLVTTAERIAFASRYARAGADVMADEVRRFLAPDGGPDLLLEYDSLGEIAPHAVMWGVVALFLIAGSFVEPRMRKQPGVKATSGPGSS